MASPKLTIQELFDPDFLASVERLKILARRVAPAGTPAEKRSKQQGAGLEFRDYRPYSSGDDIKSIDWNVYNRLGKLFLRLFEEQRNLPVYLAPDISASMFFGENPRGAAALRAAFAFAAIALHEADSVGVFPFSDHLEMALRPASGSGRLMRVAQTLTGLEPGGETDFTTSMKRLSAIRMREGLLIVFSDFFDPKGIDAVVDSLKHVRHRLLLVQLVRKTDRDPKIEGDLLLRDCESGEEQNVSATSAVLDAYRRSYQDFETKLQAFARSRRAGLLRLDVDEDVVDQLGTLFETGAYVV
jgi:uncharacterized protein (DUF58 family)